MSGTSKARITWLGATGRGASAGKALAELVKIRFQVAVLLVQPDVHTSIANRRSAVKRAPESGSSAARTGRSEPLAAAGRSIADTLTRLIVRAVEPARSTATNGCEESTDAVSLTPAQLVASVSSIRAPGFRLPGLLAITFAPLLADARLAVTSIDFVRLVEPTVIVVRVMPFPGATNSTL